MRTFRRGLAFALAFILSVIIMTLLFTPPSGIKILLNEAKSTEYDTLILGQSHGECGYNPYIISDELGCNAINISRRLTPIDNMYYILKEANKNNQYKRVIIDVDPFYWTVDNSRDWGTDMLLFRHLSGLDRFRYFKEIMWPQNYNILFCDYYISTKNIELIPDALRAKLSKSYISNQDEAMVNVNKYLGADKNFTYNGRGYLFGVTATLDVDWDTWQYAGIDGCNIDAFIRIKEYCDANGIELIMVQSAMPPERLKTQDFGVMHDDLTNYFEQNGLKFYDFNYAKKEYLSRTDYDYVDREGHMMGYLADAQTKLLCDILNGNDSQKYFYNNYFEVISNLQ